MAKTAVTVAKENIISSDQGINNYTVVMGLRKFSHFTSFGKARNKLCDFMASQ